MAKLGKKKKAQANARPLSDEERNWMRAFAMAALTTSFMSQAFGPSKALPHAKGCLCERCKPTKKKKTKKGKKAKR
jgi:hypothetical protein